MKDTYVIVFTMKGCPYCVEFKDMLNESGIEFYDRDIHEYDDEYALFTKITENEFIPSIMIVEKTEQGNQSYFYAPERDFQELTEAVEKVKKHLI